MAVPRFACLDCGYDGPGLCHCTEAEFRAQVASDEAWAAHYREQEKKPRTVTEDAYASLGHRYADRPHLLEWDEEGQI